MAKPPNNAFASMSPGKTTLAAYQRSPADAAEDKRNAAKRGESVAAWKKTPEAVAIDKRAVAKINGQGKPNTIPADGGTSPMKPAPISPKQTGRGHMGSWADQAHPVKGRK